MLSRLLILAGSILPSTPIALREGPPLILDPRSYSSPSGRFLLEVDPSDRDGSGPGRYRLTREGEELWSGEKPFTFWGAVVAEDGRVAGYGYSEGLRGRPLGQFVIAILDPQGELVARHDEARERHHPEGPPDPHAVGIFLDEHGDRLVVRVRSRSLMRDTWWKYRLSDGEAIGRVDPERFVPDAVKNGSLSAARAVPGTPLTLMHWRGWRQGATVALLDAEEKLVWSLDLPQENFEADDPPEERRMDAWIREGGSTAVGTLPGRFEIRSFAGQTRTRFEASADSTQETRWKVRQIDSEPHRVSFEPPPEPPIPTIRLEKLGSVVLGAGIQAATPLIRNVDTFAFDSAGNLEFVRRPADREVDYSWCRVDSKGQRVGEQRFDSLRSNQEARRHWLRISDERWLTTTSGYGPRGVAKASWVNTGTGAVEEIADFECPPIESLARNPRGGFVVLGQVREEFQVHSILLSFDKEARLRWKSGGDAANPQKPGDLFAPSSVAVTNDGSVVVVSSIRKTLQVFDPDGAYTRSIELSEAWGVEPGYPAYVVASESGDLFVGDTGGNTNSVWRMRLDGGTASRIELRHADGHQPAPRVGALRVAPDGRSWTTDGQVFERIGPDGVVDGVLGTLALPGAPSGFEDPFVDSLGRVLALDRRARVVQVFDREGEVLAIGRFEPEDTPVKSRLYADAGDGLIRVRAQKNQYVSFDSKGTRLGREALSPEPAPVVFRPGTQERWVLPGYVAQSVLHAGDGSGASASRPPILRRPDGRWLRSIHSLVVSADGTVIVHDGSSQFPDTPSAISTFPADGGPGRRIELPRNGLGDRLAVLRKWFAIGSGNSVFLVEREGRRILQAELELPADGDPWIHAFASPDQNELWIVDNTTRSLTRYAVP